MWRPLPFSRSDPTMSPPPSAAAGALMAKIRALDQVCPRALKAVNQVVDQLLGRSASLAKIVRIERAAAQNAHASALVAELRAARRAGGTLMDVPRGDERPQ